MITCTRSVGNKQWVGESWLIFTPYTKYSRYISCLNDTVDADAGSMQVHPFALEGLDYLRTAGMIYYTTLL
jgi:hypothetical protein